MAGLMIGELARRAGVATSALRYYEKAGLLPSPARVSKRRQYDPAVLGRIRIILLARDAGFSINETRTFLNGFPVGTRPALRWRAMAQRKIAELDELTTRLGQMRSILDASFHCECRLLEDCERLAAKACREPESRSRRVSTAKASAARLRARPKGSNSIC
jgi:MerR family redox-sensitive transcriptional activator SoxR